MNRNIRPDMVFRPTDQIASSRAPRRINAQPESVPVKRGLVRLAMIYLPMALLLAIGLASRDDPAPINHQVRAELLGMWEQGFGGTDVCPWFRTAPEQMWESYSTSMNLAESDRHTFQEFFNARCPM